MSLTEEAVDEIGRLLNGKGNSQHGAIDHLIISAVRAAESLIYLDQIDAERFNGVWPTDGYDNSVIDDAHVRWSTSSALTCLDLCIAAASRLGNFKRHKSPAKEDSIRAYYSESDEGKIRDCRHKVPPPWRGWIDGVTGDSRYGTLLQVRNALVHADFYRNYFSSVGPIQGHSMRCGYFIGPLMPTGQVPTYPKIQAREIIEFSRDLAMTHIQAFVDVLRSLP